MGKPFSKRVEGLGHKKLAQVSWFESAFLGVPGTLTINLPKEIHEERRWTTSSKKGKAIESPRSSLMHNAPMKMKSSETTAISIMILWILTALNAIQLTSQTEKVISVVQPSLLVAENKSATVLCSYTCNSPEMKTFKASMFKGTARNVEVCSVTWNKTFQKYNDSKSEISCRAEANTTAVKFNLFNLSVAHTDIYLCKIEVIYPAPYHHSEGNGTVIHVKEELQREQRPEYSGAMAAGLAIIACYSVAVTGALVYCRVRNRKKRLPQKDYHNMISWQVNSPKKRNSQPSVPARTYTTYRFWEP
uniref:T-cell-specific surface glycoprotein CD28 n=1 Tax=Euleptes europaea TaxID=460621 RepID=UPI0025418D4A|nr:T-cell-specific surface glycoprotein CD28 [Euleptes europaea]